MNSAVIGALSRRSCTPTSLHIACNRPLTPGESGGASAPTTVCASTSKTYRAILSLLFSSFRTPILHRSHLTQRPACPISYGGRTLSATCWLPGADILASWVGGPLPELPSGTSTFAYKQSFTPGKRVILPRLVSSRSHWSSSARPMTKRPPRALDMCIPHAGDCLLLANFFLLRPGEYSKVPFSAADDHFRVQDIGVWIGHCCLDLFHCPTNGLLSAIFFTLTFTIAEERHSWRDAGARSQRTPHSLFLSRRSRIASSNNERQAPNPPLPLNTLHRTTTDSWNFVRPANITTLLRRAVRLLPPSLTDLSASDISARCTHAGGAMAMLCGGINLDHIRLIGRLHFDELNRYLHVQAQPIMSGVASCHNASRRQLSPRLPTHRHHRRWPTLSSLSGSIARRSAPTRHLRVPKPSRLLDMKNQSPLI